MKKIFYALSAIVMTGFVSCEKEDIEDIIGMEASQAMANVTVSSSNYERVETTPLEFDGRYISSGVLEYREDGEVVTVIDFSDTENGYATKMCNGENSQMDLRPGMRHPHKHGKKKRKLRKVIIEPLVKAEDCDFIVAGIIEFYKGPHLVATIDFGDGTCDNIATKTTDAGTFEFELHPLQD